MHLFRLVRHLWWSYRQRRIVAIYGRIWAKINDPKIDAHTAGVQVFVAVFVSTPKWVLTSGHFNELYWRLFTDTMLHLVQVRGETGLDGFGRMYRVFQGRGNFTLSPDWKETWIAASELEAPQC